MLNNISYNFFLFLTYYQLSMYTFKKPLLFCFKNHMNNIAFNPTNNKVYDTHFVYSC